MRLLAHQSSNAKLSKNADVTSDWETSILYLVPSDGVSGLNLCPAATAGCRQACLFTAGRGRMQSVVDGRTRKTLLWRDDRAEFMRQLVSDLETLSRKAFNKVNQAVRLNGTSDIDWENVACYRHGRHFVSVMHAFPELMFYDYTKRPERAFKACLTNAWPSNYRLTFSRSEANGALSQRLATAGGNVAVVFRETLPPVYLGRPVIDGTSHDMRFLDPAGVIVGLLAKGAAKRDTSGFVIDEGAAA